jgi:anaerobic ribonucleoside-triphosphate reductase activating protein
MLNINSLLPESEVNGPGRRFVIWTQGCLKRCPGCFNPLMQNLTDGYTISVDTIYKKIVSNNRIEGISISGGEPFLQSFEILELLKRLKSESKMSVLIYTGMTIDEINIDNNLKKIRDLTDVLIAGPYIHELKNSGSLLASSNQVIHLITDRYSIEDFNLPESEIIITPDGKTLITGINPVIINN